MARSPHRRVQKAFLLEPGFQVRAPCKAVRFKHRPKCRARATCRIQGNRCRIRITITDTDKRRMAHRTTAINITVARACTEVALSTVRRAFTTKVMEPVGQG